MAPKPKVAKHPHDKIFAPNFLVTIEMMQGIRLSLFFPRIFAPFRIARFEPLEKPLRDGLNQVYTVC